MRSHQTPDVAGSMTVKQAYDYIVHRRLATTTIWLHDSPIVVMDGLILALLHRAVGGVLFNGAEQSDIF